MNPAMEERRKYRRIPVQNDVMVRRLEDQERKVSKSKILGMGGLMFTSAEPYGVGTFLDLFVVIGGGVHQMHARVANERRISLGEYEIGVEFLHLGIHAAQALHWILETPRTEH